MKNCLILLTNYYPFHKGEEYLESEIDYLATNFEHIYIISTMVSKEMTQTRRVPENVTVIPIGIDHSVFGKIKMSLSHFKDIVTDQFKRKLISTDTRGKLLAKLYCIYFESRAMSVYNNLKQKLKNIDFSKYEKITIYSYWLYITARVAIDLKNNFFKNKDTYVFSRAHRYDLYEEFAPLGYLPEREYLLQHLDEVFPVSQDGVQSLVRKFPNYSNKITVKRLGTFSTNTISKFNRDKLYIVSCSIVRKVKRLDLLIEALAELEKKEVPYHWTHIGDGPEFQRIKKLAQNKLNMENVHFTRFLKNQDVINWYKDNYVTVFINISASEGVPVSIMEAMSMQIPIIATDVGGTGEIVENNKNGFLLPENCSVHEIVDALLKLKKMSIEDYNSLRHNAFSTWKEKSNAEILYSEFAKMIANK